MKKLIPLLFLPLALAAQKPIKPSVSKAEAALQKGVFDEAKAIIDATVANQEFMLDKKGQPSKNAAKAWYLKGLIYACIDTTKVEKYKSLEADPFAIAKLAFAKAEDIDKGKSKGLVNQLILGQPIEISKENVSKILAQAFLNRSYKNFQSKEYKAAFADAEKVIYLVSSDTTLLMNVGVYFGPSAGEIDKSIEFIKKYLALGGKNLDAYIQLYTLYTDKKDLESALKVTLELTSKFPYKVEFVNMEFNLYTQLNRLPEAKTLMEKRAKNDPNDKQSRYFIGLISNQMKNTAETRKWMLEAVKIDPEYHDANLVLAKLTYTDAQDMRTERNATKDLKKRQELYLQLPGKLHISEAYWEKCVAAKPSEEESLYGLLSIYNDISIYDEKYEPKITELKKKMKALGLEVD